MAKKQTVPKKKPAAKKKDKTVAVKTTWEKKQRLLIDSPSVYGFQLEFNRDDISTNSFSLVIHLDEIDDIEGEGNSMEEVFTNAFSRAEDALANEIEDCESEIANMEQYENDLEIFESLYHNIFKAGVIK